jgi:hypothetical protein
MGRDEIWMVSECVEMSVRRAVEERRRGVEWYCSMYLAICIEVRIKLGCRWLGAETYRVLVIGVHV